MEMKEMREKGLCYNCDEKLTPNHKCKTQWLYLMDGSWPRQEGSGEDEPDSEEDWEPESNIDATTQVSLYAVLGEPTPQTMWIKGSINDVLIFYHYFHTFLA